MREVGIEFRALFTAKGSRWSTPEQLCGNTVEVQVAVFFLGFEPRLARALIGPRAAETRGLLRRENEGQKNDNYDVWLLQVKGI